MQPVLICQCNELATDGWKLHMLNYYWLFLVQSVKQSAIQQLKRQKLIVQGAPFYSHVDMSDKFTYSSNTHQRSWRSLNAAVPEKLHEKTVTNIQCPVTPTWGRSHFSTKHAKVKFGSVNTKTNSKATWNTVKQTDCYVNFYIIMLDITELKVKKAVCNKMHKPCRCICLGSSLMFQLN